jgi:plastocyanin
VRRLSAGVLIAVAALLAAPALAADHTYTAGPQPDHYATDSVTIDQGDTITFSNQDSGGFMHNVTATQKGPDGKPLFASDTIGPGKTAPVNGVASLKAGDYPFICTIHPTLMTGTLHVTANGTPQAPPPDTTPPTASVAIPDSKIGPVLKRKALRVSLKTDESATFKLTAKAGKTTLATGTITATTGKTASIKLTTAGRKLLAKSKSVTVRLTASVADSAGNRAAASATRKLRR